MIISKSQKAKDDTKIYLLDEIDPGDTVYTVLRHVSRSGMSRSISVIVLTEDYPNNGVHPRDVSFSVAKLLGMSYDMKTGGVKVNGCGMDMGFHLVSNLSYALFGLETGNQLRQGWL